jgi:hypothetical protein
MLSKERLQKILTEKGVAAASLAANPDMFERACGIAYSSIPFPWRWFIGKKRLRKAMGALREQIVRMEPK